MLMFDVPPPVTSKGIEAYRKTWDLFFSWARDPVVYDINEIDITAGDDVTFVTALMRCGAGTERSGQAIELDFRLTIGLRKIAVGVPAYCGRKRLCNQYLSARRITTLNVVGSDARKAHIMNDEEIRKVADEFVGAWNRREVRSIAPLLTDDMEFVNALGLWWQGPTDVINGLETMDVFGATIAPDPRRVRIVLPNAAIYSSSFTVSRFVGPDGKLGPEQHGVMTLFMVNQGRRWLIAAGQIPQSMNR